MAVLFKLFAQGRPNQSDQPQGRDPASTSGVVDNGSVLSRVPDQMNPMRPIPLFGADPVVVRDLRERTRARLTYPHADPKVWQDWCKVGLETDMEAMKGPGDAPCWHLLVKDFAWKMAIDIADKEPNNKYAVRMSVRVYNPDHPAKDAGGFVWQIADQFVMYRAKVFAGDPVQLMVSPNSNGEDAKPQGPLGIRLEVSPDWPGESRLTIAQIGGISSVVRFLRY